MRKTILRLDIFITIVSLVTMLFVQKIPYLTIILFFSLGIQIIRCVYGTVACIVNIKGKDVLIEVKNTINWLIPSIISSVIILLIEIKGLFFVNFINIFSIITLFLICGMPLYIFDLLSNQNNKCYIRETRFLSLIFPLNTILLFFLIMQNYLRIM